MSHELAETLGGLASRVNNLAVVHRGTESRKLLELQDRLAKLELAAIAKELRAEHEDYKAALAGIQEATALIGDADQEIERISETIHLIAKAAELVDKALKTAAL